MNRITAANTGLAKVAVQCSADTFVVNQSFVLRINICGENRHLRQARNRYRQFFQTIVRQTKLDQNLQGKNKFHTFGQNLSERNKIKIWKQHLGNI